MTTIFAILSMSLAVVGLGYIATGYALIGSLYLLSSSFFGFGAVYRGPE